MKKYLFLIFLSFACFTNCSTSLSLLMNTAGKSQGYHAPIIYGGTRMNVGVTEEQGISLYTLDFPFSFAFDTVLLPVTIPWAIFGK